MVAKPQRGSVQSLHLLRSHAVIAIVHLVRQLNMPERLVKLLDRCLEVVSHSARLPSDAAKPAVPAHGAYLRVPGGQPSLCEVAGRLRCLA
ncbi:hypothetical protein GCM10011608_53020 [Micromonospora sonchi]|uniref:Uncharacterized protein n=1 Tax=Micromonospora sonchi TaxID=1763543 RepID=A0A917U6A5_9ACTN|nr:hypothetical protein GCM10011608_53020 [Micromonospora sonchi]